MTDTGTSSGRWLSGLEPVRSDPADLSALLEDEGSILIRSRACVRPCCVIPFLCHTASYCACVIPCLCQTLLLPDPACVRPCRVRPCLCQTVSMFTNHLVYNNFIAFCEPEERFSNVCSNFYLDFCFFIIQMCFSVQQVLRGRTEMGTLSCHSFPLQGT